LIYRLTGTITEITSDAIVLKSGSIEWFIEVSKTTASQFSTSKGEISILTYLYHREDVLLLFGFGSEKEKKLFHALLTVQGIGPRAAMKILSSISPEEFYLAINSEDLARLEMIPGLGKKTAQKVLLTLAGKLILEDKSSNQVNFSNPLPVQRGPWIDIEEALVSMGYEKKYVKDELPNQLLTIVSKIPDLAKFLNESNQRQLEELTIYVMNMSKHDKEKLEGELLKECILALS
jgi:Holliday junction DNA helicase RuvA